MKDAVVQQLKVVEYNLTLACSLGHTDAHTYSPMLFSLAHTHNHLTCSHTHKCEIQEAHMTVNQSRPVRRAAQ